MIQYQIVVKDKFQNFEKGGDYMLRVISNQINRISRYLISEIEIQVTIELHKLDCNLKRKSK